MNIIMVMKKTESSTGQNIDFFRRLSMVAECKAAILWARRQLRYAFNPLGITLGECYLCGSLRWPRRYERTTFKIAKVISRNISGDVREVALKLSQEVQGAECYIDKLSSQFPGYSEFLSKIRYSDMDACITPYKDGQIWSRYNLDFSTRKLLDGVNSEVDSRFNISPCYSAIEIGYPALKDRCTNILYIPVWPSPKLFFMKDICTPVRAFIEEKKK